MTRRQFSRKFKLEAVRLVRKRGVSVVQASRDLDVGESLFRRWLKEFSSDPEQAFPGQGQLKPERQEIERLRREVAKHRGIWPVRWLCEALGVSRSGFHAWLTRSPVPGRAATEFSAHGSRRALLAAIERMVPGGSGMTFWPKVPMRPSSHRASDA